MTPAEIDLVKKSWLAATISAAGFAELFYRRLFELDPGLRRMFSDDMASQQRKLIVTLTAIIDYLDAPEVLLPKIHELGIRHSGYGVNDAHYLLVEQVLIWTLEQNLGDAFDSATEQAWRDAYRILADAMRTAEIDNLMYPG